MKEVEIQRPEPVEILPTNVGSLSSKEAAPLLNRAASRIDIVKPKTSFWDGMKENLKGAAAYLDAKKNQLASKTFRAIAGASLVAIMVSACARPTEGDFPLPTQTLPTATEVFTPTPEATPTIEANPTPEAPVNEWRLSTDGRIFYNEATLAEGLFTINEGATQYTWDEMIRSLYQINVAGQNESFLSRFPTLDSFRSYAASGEMVESLWIPIDYPKTGSEYAFQAAWTLTEPIDLSTIAIEFTYSSYDDIVSGVRDERPFVERRSGSGILFERVEIDGRPLIKVIFHQSVMYDDSEWGVLGFSSDYPPEHNLQSATQVILGWFWLTDHMRNERGGWIRYESEDPPLFNIDLAYPNRSEYAGFAQDLGNSLFVLR